MRINRYLSSCGMGSRRKSEKLVLERRVKVNGAVITDLSFQVQKEDQVQVDERLISPQKSVFYLFHKPRGYMVSHFDPHCEKLIYDLLPDAQGLFAVGRLDVDSEGLLFVTNQGRLADEIAHPSNEIEKEYWVVLNHCLEPSHCQKARKGIQGKDHFYRVDRMEVHDHFDTAKEWMNLSGDVDPRSVVRVVLHEGKKREVRRIFKSLGYTVERLFRVRIGPITIEGLLPGHFREISPKEMDALLSEIKKRKF